MLSNKEQVKRIIRDFIVYVENHFKTTIKVVRSDNEIEILQNNCKSMFAEKRIRQQRSVACVPHQNGRVEGKHGLLIKTARAIKIHAGMLNYLWGECVLAATHIINLLPSPVLNWQTPYERLMKKMSSYNHLRVVRCFMHLTLARMKISLRKRDKMYIIGVSWYAKAYMLFDLQEKQIIVSKDVVFKGKIFPFKKDSIHTEKNYEDVRRVSDLQPEDGHNLRDMHIK